MHLIGHALFASAERARRLLRFGGDIRGLALLEFALALPLVLAMGGYGVEIAHLALTNLRVSQIALELADNASRVGVTNGLSVEQLREADINDILQAARLVGGGLGLTTFGPCHRLQPRKCPAKLRHLTFAAHSLATLHRQAQWHRI